MNTKMHIAVLLTSYNRVEKTIQCLKTFYHQAIPEGLVLDVILVDDNSTDNTGTKIKGLFPDVKVLFGSGSLFWVGGMRMAWNEALKNNYDGYLLLNDDVQLNPDMLVTLMQTHQYALSQFQKGGIYIGSTVDPFTNKISYGGRKLTGKFSDHSVLIEPDQKNIKECDFANANILLVMKNVTEKTGVLSDRFTQRLADYDYTLTAKKEGFPLLICPGYLGKCEDDHGKNWLTSSSTLGERINYLKNPKHLAYKEYLFFMKTHFPLYTPVSFVKLWLKTLFPVIWTKFKRS